MLLHTIPCRTSRREQHPQSLGSCQRRWGARRVTLNPAKKQLLQLLLAFAPTFYFWFVRKFQRAVVKVKGTPMEPSEKSPICIEGNRQVLIVDHELPDPTSAAGSKAILHVAQMLVDIGFGVTFWSDSIAPLPKGGAPLTTLGVKVVTRGQGRDLAEWLGKPGKTKPFAAVILSRPTIAAKYARDVRQRASERCLYYGHDIHHRRMAGMSQNTAQRGGWFERKTMEKIEHSLWRTMDVVFYPSGEEVELVDDLRAKAGLARNATVLPLWAAPERRPEYRLQGREGMLFVGSFAHAPNVDGLNWFLKLVLPRIRAKGYAGVVRVVGFGMEQYRPVVLDENVKIMGWVDKAMLDSLYDTALMALAPLTYGAGVKGKVLEALAHGLPCVTTTVGAQGLEFAAEALRPVDDVEGFADAVVLTATDTVAWLQRSKAGFELLAEHYRSEAIREILCAAIEG